MKRMIGEHARTARPLERQQRFQNQLVSVARAGGNGSLNHRIFARHLIGEDRHFKGR